MTKLSAALRTTVFSFVPIKAVVFLKIDRFSSTDTSPSGSSSGKFRLIAIRRITFVRTVKIGSHIT